jgi:hypothetical protein
MHYMSYRSYQMQEHKFDITCPRALFVETASGPSDHEQ